MLKSYEDLKLVEQPSPIDRYSQRILGGFKTSRHGPTLIVIAGIHGNEPAGVLALERIVQKIEASRGALAGNFYAVAGNLQALNRGERFIEEDLNRIWNSHDVKGIEDGTIDAASLQHERKEQYELYRALERILKENPPPYYFIDLHTVSAQSCPFAIIDDMLINRELARQIPTPVILGMEEYIEGSILNRVNKMGHVAVGFESGVHENPGSIDKHESFVWLILKYTGCLSENFNLDIAFHSERISSELQHEIFEVKYQYRIQPGEQFHMEGAYVNFQEVSKGEGLASNANAPIRSPLNGRIFMPLYQSQGQDGFFVIRKVSKFALTLSSFLRKANFENLLTALPGVKRHPEKDYILIVDVNVARFLALQLFHLLGYRQRQRIGHQIHFTRREWNVRASHRKEI